MDALESLIYNINVKYKNDILLTKDVLEILNVRVDTLMRWRRDKKGPKCFKQMGRNIYLKKDLIDWIRKDYEASNAFDSSGV